MSLEEVSTKILLFGDFANPANWIFHILEQRGQSLQSLPPDQYNGHSKAVLPIHLYNSFKEI